MNLKGDIKIYTITSVRSLGTKNKRGYLFEIEAERRTFLLAANSDDGRKAWCDRIEGKVCAVLVVGGCVGGVYFTQVSH